MKKILLLAALAAATMGLSAQNFEKVTLAPADWSGTYLIVCEGQSVVFNGAADTLSIDAKGGPAVITGIAPAGGQIAATEALLGATFTISATDDALWPWAIQSASGLYIGHKDSVVADNGLSAELTLKNKCKHTLAIDASGNFIATPRYELGGEYNLQYNKKADQQRFRYFVPADKQPIQLYRLVGGSTGLSSTRTGATSGKCYEDGQLVIIKDGVRYSVLGTRL